MAIERKILRKIFGWVKVEDNRRIRNNLEMEEFFLNKPDIMAEIKADG